MSETLFYQKATKTNTCPECGKALMLPYYPNGFESGGIIQCVSCDYSKQTKAASKVPSQALESPVEAR